MTGEILQPVMSAEETQAYLEEVFPQQRGVYRIVEVAPMRARIAQTIRYENLRPGDTVSGPTLFAIADCAFYTTCLAMVGREAMMVTASTSITFLRRPPAADLWAEARILKFGRTLISGDVLIHSEAVDQPVAHAALSYARPQSG